MANVNDKKDGSPNSSHAPTLKDDVKQELGHETDDDEIIVDWDGPNDPENPRNWTIRHKWAATFAVSGFSFISPLSSSMMAPAGPQISADFGIKTDIIFALSVSVFVLAFAFGPLILGPMSEIYGRSLVVQLSNVWFFAWNLACGFAQNTGQMIAFRALAGLGGSAPLSIGGGVVGDVWSTEDRGRAIALFSLAPLLGPVVGPIAGAWIAEKTNWRWVFWSSCIGAVVIQLVGMFLLHESFAPVLLERKANKIKKDMTKEKQRRVRTVFETADRHWKQIIYRALTRPFQLFIREPIIQLLGLYMSFVYGLLYLFLTTIPLIFEGVYKERVGIAGLHYIAFGIGLCGASLTNARLLDAWYTHFKNKNGGVGKPEFRLPPIIPGTIVVPVGLFLAGWTTRPGIHWIVPDIGIALVGAGTILVIQAIQTYVIDAFTLHAASALAASTFLRSMAGFGFPLFAPAMYKALGFGKGDTILAVVSIVIGCPAPWLFWFYGERIRKASRYASGPKADSAA